VKKKEENNILKKNKNKLKNKKIYIDVNHHFLNLYNFLSIIDTSTTANII
jgi:hypothetical protein